MLKKKRILPDNLRSEREVREKRERERERERRDKTRDKRREREER